MAVMYKKTGIALIATFLLVVVGFVVLIPVVNNKVAYKTARRIEEIPLPPSTEFIEKFSAAGKLVGNGNGMEYLGGVIIKSGLSLEELQLYYSQYAKNEWECIVEKQTSQRIQFIEHENVSLEVDIDDDGYYVVYSWGDNASFFSKIDPRGH